MNSGPTCKKMIDFDNFHFTRKIKSRKNENTVVEKKNRENVTVLILITLISQEKIKSCENKNTVVEKNRENVTVLILTTFISRE